MLYFLCNLNSSSCKLKNHSCVVAPQIQSTMSKLPNTSSESGNVGFDGSVARYKTSNIDLNEALAIGDTLINS